MNQHFEPGRHVDPWRSAPPTMPVQVPDAPDGTAERSPARDLIDRITGAARRDRIRRIEGPRGAATRSSIWMRYAAYFGVIIGCSSLTQAVLAKAGTTQNGGLFMLFAVTLMALTAAGGAAVYPTHRDNIVEELRHYLFGLCLYPATGIAVVIWAINSMLSAPTTGQDTMAQLLHFSVPVVFVCTLIIPPVIFIKVVAGATSLHRSQLDDEEMVALYTRQDMHQR